MGDEISSMGFGVKNKSETLEPPDHNTIFRIGSISKVFAVRLQFPISTILLYEIYPRTGSSDVSDV